MNGYLLLCSSAFAWWSVHDRYAANGIISYGPFNNPKNELGCVYDHAVVDAHSVDSLMLPDSFVLHETGTDGVVELYMEKYNWFTGHPPKPITLNGVRKNMGCAKRFRDASLTIATFGEFTGGHHGGAVMLVIAYVPSRLNVSQAANLSGNDTPVYKSGEYNFVRINDAYEEYWYTPPTLASAWTAIESEPDPWCTAKTVAAK